MHRRKALQWIGQGSLLPFVAVLPKFPVRSATIDLRDVRERINEYFASLLSPARPYGVYGTVSPQETDLYASCDVAIARHIMGESLTDTLTDLQKQQWIHHINSYQVAEDGSYTERFGHSRLHANGMVIGALGVLGGRQRFPVRLYKPFDTVREVVPWLEQIDWAKQWSASHLFWGGIHCYSLSSACTDAWRETVFAWLNDNLDEKTGWWRKDMRYTDRHQPLGGSVHILPMYQHHDRPFPYPERVIDSVLALQLPNGRWLDRPDPKVTRQHVMHYLELDALYALHYMGTLVPGYRKEAIGQAVHRYADLVVNYWHDPQSGWRDQHPHRILSMVGTFGLLQKLLPDGFVDDIAWTDIFSDIRLYDTRAVEVL
ncbi:hypothetical protein [Persicitalea jodogahamensis]|uniref:Uncharacterized protein n=1 Tax=Persicitalea jodogahamensis TaxID=402147 RepID=A0A8J3DDE6_9BACT|nr:hypothetical protein [Persicitalea jodogahamensis]GHB86779.1 hypothetical protein GCM10007390_48110 [Persicitalea jodogahamensis]